MIRRAIGTTLAGICALAGPCATSALADTAPALNLGVSSARQGIPFTVSGAACPSDSGEQSVRFSFTDSAGLIYPVGEVDTDEDGTWSGASIALPVAGIDADGAWLENGAATGAGTLNATCVAPAESADDPGDDDSGDVGDDDGSDATDPGDDDSTDPGDDDGGDDAGDIVTLTYAPAALSVTGTAPQLAVVTAGHTLTVTPAEGCTGGASDVTVALIGVGDDNASDDPADVATATTTSTGAWSPVTLTEPSGSTGDYAVTAVCAQGSDDDAVVTSSYDAVPLGLGSVLLSKPVCTAKGAVVKVGGSYSGALSSNGKAIKAGLIKLSGEGPWKVGLRSAETGKLLLSQSVACAADMFDLDVAKPAVSGKGAVKVKVCNTGRAGVTAVLQTLDGKKFVAVDKESLDPGECTVLSAGKVKAGADVKARVLADPPGGGAADADVVATFTVHRPKH